MAEAFSPASVKVNPKETTRLPGGPGRIKMPPMPTSVAKNIPAMKKGGRVKAKK